MITCPRCGSDKYRTFTDNVLEPEIATVLYECRKCSCIWSDKEAKVGTFSPKLIKKFARLTHDGVTRLLESLHVGGDDIDQETGMMHLEVAGSWLIVKMIREEFGFNGGKVDEWTEGKLAEVIKAAEGT